MLRFPLSLGSNSVMAQPPQLFLILPYRETETLLVATPRKIQSAGTFNTGMQENGLRLWICDFSLLFVGERHN